MINAVLVQGADVSDSLHNIACPGLTLRADHACTSLQVQVPNSQSEVLGAFGNATQSLTKVAASAPCTLKNQKKSEQSLKFCPVLILDVFLLHFLLWHGWHRWILKNFICSCSIRKKDLDDMKWHYSESFRIWPFLPPLSIIWIWLKNRGQKRVKHKVKRNKVF